MRTIVTIAFLLFSLLGCKAPSANLQLAALRSSGDVAATLILDHKDVEKVERTRTKITGIAEGAITFLARGEVAGLTRGELRAELLRAVPERYRPWGEQALSAASTREVNVQRIGAANVARLRAFVRGTLAGARAYDQSLRPPRRPAGGP